MNENSITPAGNPATTAKLTTAEIAESVLGEIIWVSDDKGYCECPGKNRHTTRDGRRDCILYLDRVPTLHCVHGNCGPSLEAANKKLRDAILNNDPDQALKPRKLSAEEKRKLKERAENERIRQRAAKSLTQLIANNPWTYDQIITDSRVKVQGNEENHWRLLLARFKSEDVIWIGGVYDSGKPEHASHFRTAEQWLKESGKVGPFICPAVFKNTSIARSNENIVRRAFLVVESDTLSKNQVGSIFRWLRDQVKLDLVAIVDTAGKSLHGWFVYPDEEKVDELKWILPSLGCDPKLFTASQPVRLPGALRDGKYQKLVYLTAEVTNE